MSLQGNNEKGKTRNKEKTRATNRFNARRYKKDVVGYSVLDHLPEVEGEGVSFPMFMLWLWRLIMLVYRNLVPKMEN